MNSSEQRLTCAQAREMDMVDYLAAAGHKPTKIRNFDYWYVSPLREEETASFKINRVKNVWYDHGLGKGGNLIDFAILYHNCTIGEFLQSLQGNFSFHKPAFVQSEQTSTENKVQVIQDFLISSSALVSYLKQRHIPYELADLYCREVRYQLNEKIYYGIGFKNDTGGYELRNSYCKNSSSPKDIRTIKNGALKVAVFEGFFDFLSFLVLCQNWQPMEWDFCILNSLSFFEKARPFLEQYASIYLFLDNDRSGQNCSRYALNLNKNYMDESGLYKNYKDLNEWLTTMGKQPP
jgi:hypothetical protein